MGHSLIERGQEESVILEYSKPQRASEAKPNYPPETRSPWEAPHSRARRVGRRVIINTVVVKTKKKCHSSTNKNVPEVNKCRM